MADDGARPAVSAIIVVRDGLPFIGEAIESVLAQSYGSWELLIVDDGSTDGTPELAESYHARHPLKIRLLRHPSGVNLGIAASRNLGIAEALGRYLAFLDADDVWLPQKLSEQVALFEADPELGIVYGRTLIWHSWEPGTARGDYFYDLGVEPEARYEPPVLFILLLENRAQSPTTCNAMIRAALFAEIGTFDPAVRGMFEDLSFFGKALAIRPAYVSGRTWAKYRQHGASCSAASAAAGGDEWARLKALGRLERALAPFAPQRSVRRALRLGRFRAARDLMHRWRRSLRRMLRAR